MLDPAASAARLKGTSDPFVSLPEPSGGGPSFLRVGATVLHMPSHACAWLCVTWPPATSLRSSLTQSLPAPLRLRAAPRPCGVRSCSPCPPALCIFCLLHLAGSFPETPELRPLISPRCLSEVEPCQWHPELRLCRGTSGHCSFLYFSL